MMNALEALQRRYRGVRGALLDRLHEDFEKLRPDGADDSQPVTCSACGREMRASGTDGRMRCMNGHVL